jgi:hypothetical protein
MGVIIPQVLTEDRVSGALVVDGGLRFTGSSYLKRTPGSTGNTTTYTISCWVKRSHLAPDGSGNTNSNSNPIFSAGTNAGSDTDDLQFYKDAGNNNAIRFVAYPGAFRFDLSTSMVFRDVSSWYHILANYDGTTAKIYINGTQVTAFASSTQNGGAGNINTTDQHVIGAACDGSTSVFRGYISQFYFIDGQALDPSYFGYTDPLTNTWRPKKLSSSVAFGTNGFYLPFDGSTPIGQDQSGRGNNWTPVNFGGSNTIEKATGALPILNTDGGGKVARVGVRTDSSASSLVLALPLVGNSNDVSHLIDSGESQKTVTVSGATAISSFSNFYGGSYDFDGSNDKITVTGGSGRFAGQSDFTLECWYYLDATTTDCGLLSTTNSFGSNTRSIIIGPNASGDSKITFLVNPTGSGGWTTVENSLTATTGKWTHVALTYTASTTTCQAFVDGVKLGSASVTPYNNQDANLYIGVNGGDGSGYFNGKVQDVRWTNAVKYTQNFIPASTDPDIVPDSPSGVSYSSNLTQITDGAVSFDGTNDSLSIPDSADFTFGSGDFTMEAFVYCNNASTAAHKSIVMKYTTDNASSSWFWSVYSGLQYLYFYYGSSALVINSSSFPQSVWVHCAIVRDGNTLRMFQDGIQVATGDVTGLTNNDSSVALTIGEDGQNNYDMNGFISNVRVVKGTALYTSNFTPPSAPFTSVENTKLLCCKSNSSATAFDVSPGSITANGNAAASNFNPFTVNINTQRGKQSGYATWNPLNKSSQVTLTDGNLVYSASGANTNNGVLGTIGISSGKWYWEYTCTSSTSGTNFAYLGIAGVSALPSTLYGFAASNYIYQAIDGNKKNNDVSSAYGASWTTGDVVSVVFDADIGTLTFYKNGISQGVAFSSIPSSTYTPSVSSYASGTVSGSANFGQKPFKFPPPAGFQPLTLANTPRPTIVRPDQFVGVSTYSGNAGTQSIITGFKPDFVWIKGRNATPWHALFDSVRGTGRRLSSNVTNTETGNGTTDLLQSFDTNGFTVNKTLNGVDDTSVNWDGSAGGASSYVAWCWKAGGNSNTFNINDVGYETASAAGLTAGTITPSGASVNTKSGFSIITYTGTNADATIPHGLGKIPQFIIAKSRNSSSWNWIVYHQALGVSDYLALESTQGSDTRFANIWGSGHTTSVFGVKTGYSNNPNGVNMVAYCWAEIPGFSKFGACKGSVATAQPNFNFLGFKPAFIMVKRTDSTGNWTIWDSTRNTYNPSQKQLFPNTSGAEQDLSADAIDIVSNGFVIRSSSSFTQTGSQNYIYAAWAESPSFNLYGAMSNAR